MPASSFKIYIRNWNRIACLSKMSLGWFKRMFGQAWPAPPKFTEKDIPDLHGKVKRCKDETRLVTDLI